MYDTRLFNKHVNQTGMQVQSFKRHIDIKDNEITFLTGSKGYEPDALHSWEISNYWDECQCSTQHSMSILDSEEKQQTYALQLPSITLFAKQMNSKAQLC